jgi:hypothetical protein
MAPRKRGRPKNVTPSRVVPVTLPLMLFEVLGTIAAHEGCARATLAARWLVRDIAAHGKRVRW